MKFILLYTHTLWLFQNFSLAFLRLLLMLNGKFNQFIFKGLENCFLSLRVFCSYAMTNKKETCKYFWLCGRKITSKLLFGNKHLVIKNICCFFFYLVFYLCFHWIQFQLFLLWFCHSKSNIYFTKQKKNVALFICKTFFFLFKKIMENKNNNKYFFYYI